MRKSGIIWKQFFYSSVITIITLFVLAIFTTQKLKKENISQVEKTLKAQATLLEEMLYPLLIKGNYDEIDKIVNRIGREIGTRITVIKADGEVISDSEQDAKKMENHKTRPEVVEALKGNIGESVRFSATIKKNMLYIALPVTQDTTIIGIIRTSLPLKDIESLISSINREIFYLAMWLIIFSIFLGFISSRAITKPINEILQSAKKIAGGDFATRVLINRQDELGDLARSFNLMTEEIQRLFNEVSAEKAELITILASMREGVIVLDEKAKIILTNNSFNNICKVPASENIVGRYYWEVLRNPEFKQLVDKAKDEGISQLAPVEMNIDDKIYIANANLISKKRNESLQMRDLSAGIVIVLHDITEIKKLEQVKSEFVANASHELRTPLTAIKGFVETLEEKAQNEDKRFLQIIKKHTERDDQLDF